MPRPVRVAIVNHTARLGGGEWSLLRLAERFDSDVVRPVVVLGEEGPLAERLRAIGVETVVMPLDARLRDRRKDTLSAAALANPFAAPLLARAVADRARLFKQLGVRVVHTNSLKAHVVGGLAGRAAGARVLWHVRDHISAPYLPPPAAAAMRMLARTVPHRVVAVSRSAARTVGRPDVHVLHQGVPLPQAQPPRREDGRLRVGLIGRIAPWKGQDVFLAAAARVARSLPQAEFVVVGAPLFGEHAFERALHRRAERDDLAGRVHFAGFTEDVWPLYRTLDVVVHASTLPEPYGNVILEAMASCVPVVAARAGGVVEIVDDGRTGMLVPPGDAAALAAALELLLRDPVLRRRLADAGRAEVEGRFSLERDADVLERHYVELAA
jgi:glycosyltransferase involved in cell wall biosynthesis